ncbi:MAG TPA: hypothetical protein VIX81_04190 [Gammaproteobacteria bacterium]
MLGKQLNLVSPRTKQVFVKRLQALFLQKRSDIRPKEFNGELSGNQLTLRVKYGTVVWPGRGVFKGALTPIEQGCRLLGRLNSPLLAMLAPGVLFVPLLLSQLIEAELVLGFWGLCAGFGFYVVHLDHRRLTEALEDAAEQ